MRLVNTFAVLAVLLGPGCAADEWDGPGEGGGIARAEVLGCPTQEIQFDQAHGCSNSGTIEFCIPTNDSQTERAVRRIVEGVSSVNCQAGATGQVGCRSSESLCRVRTQGRPMCSGAALSDEGWAVVCQLATLPEIRRIEGSRGP
jgi:hypothetical protein